MLWGEVSPHQAPQNHHHSIKWQGSPASSISPSRWRSRYSDQRWMVLYSHVSSAPCRRLRCRLSQAKTPAMPAHSHTLLSSTIFNSRRPVLYQLALFTPGMLPAMASIRKLYCKCQPQRLASWPRFGAYPGHLEVAQYTTALATHDASISDLSRSGIAVHLR